MKDDELKPDLDDLDTFVRRPQASRSKNWLAYQIALGIIIGGSVLACLDAITSFVAAKLLMHQVQVQLPFLSR